MARAHGAYNVVSGLWPLLHLRSFEALMGPKTDRWLVQTVAGLLVANGVAQLASAETAEGRRTARLIGIGTAGTLALIDVVYVPRGTIRRTYLIDAAAELAWIAAWLVDAGRPIER